MSSSSRVSRALRARLYWGWAAALVCFGLIYIEPMWLLREFGSDDSSYFAHAATLALDGDLDYSNESAVRWSASGRIPVGSPGAGWMAAPFVAVAGVVDRVQGHPVIGDRSSYRHSWSLFGFWVAALFFFGLGVWLYWRAIGLVWPGYDPRLNFLLALGTGVPFYVLRRFTMSHAFEFAACALAVWAAVHLYRALAAGEPTRRWLAWSGVAALANLAVRYNNLNTLFLAHAVVLLLFVAGGAGAAGVSGVARPEWARVRAALLRLTGAVAIALVPLAAFNLAFYGAPLPTPTLMYGTPLTGMEDRTALGVLAHGLTLLPNLVPLVLSSEFGILWTNPVLVLGGGFLLLLVARRLVVRRDPPHALAAAAVLGYFGLSVAIVLWWQTTGTSYGFRYLFPLYPLALLGLALAWRAGRGRARGWKLWRALVPAAIALSAVSLVSQTFFSADADLEVAPQVNVFGVYHSASGRGFLTALPGEVVRPGTWASLASRRLAGFFAAPLVIGGRAEARLPAGWVASYDRLYRDAPLGVGVQLVLVLMIWTVGGWVLVRPGLAALAGERARGARGGRARSARGGLAALAGHEAAAEAAGTVETARSRPAL